MQKDALIYEISAGGVVFRKDKNKIQYLLIRDASNRWSIPKGHVEKDEKPEQAALREIKEETGLSNLKIVRDLHQLKYFFVKEKKLIQKTVYLFLIENRSSEPLESDDKEIKDARWFSGKDALDMVNYKNIQEILKKAIIGGVK